MATASQTPTARQTPQQVGDGRRTEVAERQPPPLCAPHQLLTDWQEDLSAHRQTVAFATDPRPHDGLDGRTVQGYL